MRFNPTRESSNLFVPGLMASKDPMITGGAINASDWCYGCSGGQYVIELIPVVERYFSKYANR